MGSWTIRDLVAGLIIVFLGGVLVGDRLNERRDAAPAVVGGVASAGATFTAAPGGATVPAAPPSPSGDSALRATGDSFAHIASQVTPAVVNINATRIIRGRTYIDPFREWIYGDGRVQSPDQRAESLGSGVIVDPSGVVVTSNHNIASSGADAVEVRVSLADGRELPAKVVGVDPDSDLAVLKIDADQPLPAAQWGDSEALRVGDWVVAIGNPYGFSQTVTAGIVSAKARVDLGLSEFEEFVQTDAAINPGNSGGALVNVDGRLVGINTAIFSKSGGYQGIGFAIPSQMARGNVEQLLKHGKVLRGWIGVIVQPLNSRIAQQLSLPSTSGVLVAQLYREHPAVQAGLQPGDVILTLNDQPVRSPRDLRLAISAAKSGSRLTLGVVRAGQSLVIPVTVGQRPIRADGQPLAGT